MNAILRKRRYRRWGTVAGFLYVVGCVVATPSLLEMVLSDDDPLSVVHLLVPAAAYGIVVIVTAVVLRRSAPRPGLGVGLLEGAAWALLLVAIAVPALLLAFLSNTY